MSIVTCCVVCVRSWRCRHFQRVMHRDLKPSNVLVAAGGVAKIGDFGVSCILRGDDDTLTDVAGTPAFMAP